MNKNNGIKRFAILGVGGYIAPRHLQAIRDTGNQLVAAIDPYDSVGVLDRYFSNVKFFTEIERFDRHLEKLRRQGPGNKVDYLSICTPNYLHDAHCRLALRLDTDAICEKPLVVNPWNLDQLEALEEESVGRIYTVLQLRVHPDLLKLKAAIDKETSSKRFKVRITYITPRGPWYNVSWKGTPEKAGGIATNIGVHFFDMIQWLFGKPNDLKVYLSENERISGFVELEHADVSWFLSLKEGDLPDSMRENQPKTFRSITIDGDEVEFSGGFTDLHTKVYEKTLSGDGFGIKDARPAVELTHKIRYKETSHLDDMAHPFLKS